MYVTTYNITSTEFFVCE